MVMHGLSGPIVELGQLPSPQPAPEAEFPTFELRAQDNDAWKFEFLRRGKS
jgi:hypothetical protein